MSDSRARALLWRLVGWDESPSQFEDLLNDVESFLCQPVHPESRCQECGNDNPVWHAPHALWNCTMGTEGNPRAEGTIICPTCFCRRVADALLAQPAPEVEKPLLKEVYWCGCVRESRWVPRCRLHTTLEHDEEPLTRAEEMRMVKPRPHLSRAEAEAMVEQYSKVIHHLYRYGFSRAPSEDDFRACETARATLLAALTTEGT